MRKNIPPSFTTEEIKWLAVEHYGLSLETVRQLDSYDDQNFIGIDIKGVKRVFKLSNTREEKIHLEAQKN